jgi:hypothetical protein
VLGLIGLMRLEATAGAALQLTPTETDIATATSVPTMTVTTTPTITETETPTVTMTPIITETETPTVTATPTMTATPTPPSTAGRAWTFAAKFVCGTLPASPDPIPGEPPVKPGNYATEINIYNPFMDQTTVGKNVLLLVRDGEPVGREPAQVRPVASDSIILDAGSATMDDCTRIWELVHPDMPLPVPMPLLIGYLVVVSPRNIVVDTVMTAEAVTADGLLDGITLDAETVSGQRVVLPLASFPGGALPAPEEFEEDQQP